MPTIQEIRRANLRALLEEFVAAAGTKRGAASALSKRTQVPAPFISQLLNRRVHSGSKDRGMGDDMARKLEAGVGKPQGWMDESHRDSVVERSKSGDRPPPHQSGTGTVSSALEQLRHNLENVIESEGISQSEWARRCDVSPRAINRLLVDDHAPTLDTLESVATGLGLSVAQLLSPNFKVSPATAATGPLSEPGSTALQIGTPVESFLALRDHDRNAVLALARALSQQQMSTQSAPGSTRQRQRT